MKPVKSLHHIGIAVASIDAARSFYEDTLGAQFESLEEIPSQQVRVAFFRVQEIRLELLEPLSASSPVARFLEKRGPGLHHLAFAVDDIQARIEELQASGVEMVDTSPRVGAHQLQVAFLHPRSANGVLVEICE